MLVPGGDTDVCICPWRHPAISNAPIAVGIMIARMKTGPE
jgi:hypothetical protein